MLDIHTHILPGVDDGSRSVEQSITMLKCEAEQGITTVALTPHYDAKRETPAQFVQRREGAQEHLLNAIGDWQKIPVMLSGAEVALFEGLSRVEDLEMLCIANTHAMLVEMPFCHWTQRMLRELEELQQLRGVNPILAHIERYLSFQPKGIWSELSDGGIWLQCNTSFFLRWQTRWRAMTMLKKHLIDFVASDCHGTEYRPPNLNTAMEKIQRRAGPESIAFLRSNEEVLLERMK